MEKHIFHVTSNLSLKKREGTIKAEKVVGKCCKCLFVGVKFQIDEFRCSLTLTFSNLLPYIPVWVTRSRLVTRKDRKDVAESVVKNTLARGDASGGGWKRGRTIASNYVEWPVSGLDSGLVPHSASRVVFVSFGFARRRRRRPAVVASRRLLTLRLGCLWERKYAFRSFLPPSFSRARHPSHPSIPGRAESWLLVHGRTDIGKKCTCRGKSRDALTDITGERSWCKKRGETSLEKDPTPLGIKSFGIRIYAAAVQSFVADFTLDGEEETSSRDEIKRRNIYVTFSLLFVR